MEAIDRTDLPVILGNGVDVRSREAGAMTVLWARLPAGTDLRPALHGLPGDTCSCPHWGYMLRGRLRMHTPGGEVDFAAGQAFYWAPNHAPEALEDCEYLDFSPTEDWKPVQEHLTRG